MIRIKIDDDNRLLLITMLSGLKEHNAEQAFAEIKKYADIAHKRFGRLHMLLDARKAKPLPEVVSRKYDDYEALLLHGPEDRLAVVVSSSLNKKLTRNAMTGLRTGIFIAESSALTWLNGHWPAPRIMSA